MHDEKASHEFPRKLIYNLRLLMERLFMRSVGVQYYGSNEWSVGEPGNMKVTRPTTADEKVDPSSTFAEAHLTNKACSRCLSFKK